MATTTSNISLSSPSMLYSGYDSRGDIYDDYFIYTNSFTIPNYANAISKFNLTYNFFGYKGNSFLEKVEGGLSAFLCNSSYVGDDKEATLTYINSNTQFGKNNLENMRGTSVSLQIPVREISLGGYAFYENEDGHCIYDYYYGKYEYVDYITISGVLSITYGEEEININFGNITLKNPYFSNHKITNAYFGNYQIFQPEDLYNVKFTANAQVFNITSTPPNSTILLPDNPLREEWNFDRWVYGDANTQFTSSTTIDSDYEIVARWTQTVDTITESQCTRCDGIGTVSSTTTCTTCGGTGDLGTCNTCKGSGRVTTTTTRTCSRCHGNGEITETTGGHYETRYCDQCYGMGDHECGWCYGSGESSFGGTCSNCGGIGQVFCTACSGTGGETQVWIPPSTSTYTCYTCGGDGEISSTSTSTCSSCSGSGKDECYVCNGIGTVSSTTTCTTCGGDGEIETITTVINYENY